jgi:hypothetical protein
MVACAAAALATMAPGANAGADATASWEVHFKMRPIKSGGNGMTVDVFSDGRVVFATATAVDAPTQAVAPADLLARFKAYVDAGKPRLGPGKLTGDYALDVIAKGSHTFHVVYALDKLPSPEKELFDDADALINSPRVPVPCTAWDGKGDFTLTLVSQNFGYVPGPITTVTISSKGTATRSTTPGSLGAKPHVDKTTKVSADELAAIRTALAAIDPNQSKEIWSGAGEGSNLRLLHLSAGAASCGRAFTNTYPKTYDALFAATAPITKRL